MSSQDRELVTLEQEFKELKTGLIKIARELAAEQWFTSGTFGPSTDDKVHEAVARCKADIGDKLLEALGAEPYCRECRGEDGVHETWCSKKRRRR